MFLRRKPDLACHRSLLHACGDVSSKNSSSNSSCGFAPRMWRCFYPVNLLKGLKTVCSTHVEMFLGLTRPHETLAGLLHACGDVSIILISHEDMSKFAPRMWRCFCQVCCISWSCWVCSTHVEMFLHEHIGYVAIICLLHACGDVSRQKPNSC